MELQHSFLPLLLLFLPSTQLELRRQFMMFHLSRQPWKCPNWVSLTHGEGLWVGADRELVPLTQQPKALRSSHWRGSCSVSLSQLWKNTHISHFSQQERGQFPRCHLISIPLSPSFLKHDVISSLRYNKYFTFKSRFIKGSPGGRNNKVSLYSPNKTVKDIFYNLYLRL